MIDVPGDITNICSIKGFRLIQSKAVIQPYMLAEKSMVICFNWEQFSNILSYANTFSYIFCSKNT